MSPKETGNPAIFHVDCRLIMIIKLKYLIYINLARLCIDSKVLTAEWSFLFRGLAFF